MSAIRHPLITHFTVLTRLSSVWAIHQEAQSLSLSNKQRNKQRNKINVWIYYSSRCGSSLFFFLFHSRIMFWPGPVWIKQLSLSQLEAQNNPILCSICILFDFDDIKMWALLLTEATGEQSMKAMFVSLQWILHVANLKSHDSSATALTKDGNIQCSTI